MSNRHWRKGKQLIVQYQYFRRPQQHSRTARNIKGHKETPINSFIKRKSCDEKFRPESFLLKNIGGVQTHEAQSLLSQIFDAKLMNELLAFACFRLLFPCCASVALQSSRQLPPAYRCPLPRARQLATRLVLVLAPIFRAHFLSEGRFREDRSHRLPP